MSEFLVTLPKADAGGDLPFVAAIHATETVDDEEYNDNLGTYRRLRPEREDLHLHGLESMLDNLNLELHLTEIIDALKLYRKLQGLVPQDALNQVQTTVTNQILRTVLHDPVPSHNPEAARRVVIAARRLAPNYLHMETHTPAELALVLLLLLTTPKLEQLFDVPKMRQAASNLKQALDLSRMVQLQRVLLHLAACLPAAIHDVTEVEAILYDVELNREPGDIFRLDLALEEPTHMYLLIQPQLVALDKDQRHNLDQGATQDAVDMAYLCGLRDATEFLEPVARAGFVYREPRPDPTFGELGNSLAFFALSPPSTQDEEESVMTGTNVLRVVARMKEENWPDILDAFLHGTWKLIVGLRARTPSCIVWMWDLDLMRCRIVASPEDGESELNVTLLFPVGLTTNPDHSMAPKTESNCFDRFAGLLLQEMKRLESESETDRLVQVAEHIQEFINTLVKAS